MVQVREFGEGGKLVLILLATEDREGRTGALSGGWSPAAPFVTRWSLQPSTGSSCTGQAWQGAGSMRDAQKNSIDPEPCAMYMTMACRIRHRS